MPADVAAVRLRGAGALSGRRRVYPLPIGAAAPEDATGGIRVTPSLTHSEDARRRNMEDHLAAVAEALGQELISFATAVNKGRVPMYAQTIADGQMVALERQYGLIARHFQTALTDMILWMGHLDDMAASGAAMQRQADVRRLRDTQHRDRRELGSLSAASAGMLLELPEQGPRA
jgi:hypothetical protein